MTKPTFVSTTLITAKSYFAKKDKKNALYEKKFIVN
jgi:hypothetical protein